MSQDGFGTRTLSIDQETGDPVEVLTFAPWLARTPEFATAVGERTARLARVRHTLYARVRQLDRPSDDVLRVLSDHVPGWRLDHVLDITEHERWTLDIGAVVTLLRQLIPAVALFSRHQRDATIGTIGPERLLLTPQGRLVIAEYVLAPGLDKLQFSRERLWREFRVAVPHGASRSRIPPLADVVGIGLVGMSLLLGRRLKDDEYLVSLGDLCETLTETSAASTRRLSDVFRTWVARALQFDSDTSFGSMQEAQVAFEEMLAREKSYVTTPVQLDRFITMFEHVAGAPRTPAVAREHAAASASDPSATKARQSSRRLPAATPPASSPAPTAPTRQAPQGELRQVDVFKTSVRHVEDQRDVADTTPSPGGVPSLSNLHGTQAGSSAPSPPEYVDAIDHMAEKVPADTPVDHGRVEPVVPVPVPWWRRYAIPALLALSLVQAGIIVWLFTSEDTAAATNGALSVQSRPSAARVSINGEERGLTPFETDLAPGSHIVEVRVGRSEPRVIPVVVKPGIQTGLYVELQSVATVGGLEVRSDPEKARVTVSGQYRGETPLVVKDLPPGEVEVLVQSGNRQIRQLVRIEPGITSQLVVPLGR